MKTEDFVNFYTRLSFKEQDLARQLLVKKGIDFSSLPITSRPHDIPHLPLSFAQQRLWFLEQLGGGTAAYNIGLAMRLEGRLDIGALGRAVDGVVARHEVLRTTFQMRGDTPVQRIAPTVALSLPLSDLGGLPEAEREAEALRLAQAAAAAPFDLEAGPLLRAGLIRLSDSEHIFSITLHHVVSDGWSAGVLFHELAALYQAGAQGLPSPLPPLPIQYPDFAHWQRLALSEEVLERQLAYWAGQLAGAPAVLTLPTDHPRPKVQSYCGTTLRFCLPGAALEGLHALGRQRGATLFMVLAAAFNVLLARCSGARDICIGTPVANRNRPEVEPLIGCFVNTLVLRNRVDLGATFEQLLAQVRTGALEAYAHPDVAFEQLVERLQIERNVSHTPLFQVMLVLQNMSLGAMELPGLRMQPIAADNATAKFDLMLTLIEEADRLEAAFEYNTDLFDGATIARMTGYFKRLLEAIVADPTRALGRLPMLEQEERRRLLVEWNATATCYEGAQTIQALFEAQVARSGEQSALVFEGGALGYGELNARANRLAHRLRELGVGPDVLVAICAERSVEMVVGLLAVLKAGGAYLPLDPAYPAQRLAYMLEDAAPKVLLTQSHLLPALPAHAVPTLCLDAEEEWAGHAEHDPQGGAGPEHLAYVIYTSGSTGRPKGAGIAHAGIVNRLRWMQDAYGLRTGERVLQKTPFSFDVSVWEFFWPLITGATLVVARPGGHQDVDYLARLIEQEGVTTLHFVPPMLEVFLATAELGRCAALRRVICSGQALPLELQQRCFAQLPGVELHNLYGPTEASVDVSHWACRVDASLSSVPIGRPIANIALHVLDEELEPVPVGVAGELHIAGIGLARGYLGRGALTAEKFIPNPYGAPGSRMYKSGDLVRYLASGAIEYLGRIDEQVKIRGLRIELGEVEAALKAQAGVRDAVALAREDVPGDQRLVAYLVADQALAIEALRANLAAQLPDYMVPSALVQLAQLPLSPNGKLDRKALPPPSDSTLAPRLHEAPVGETEVRLAAIWRALLKRGQVGRHDNFFELGGNSLLAVSLVERMRRAGLEADVRTLFAAPTIAALAASVHAGAGSPVAIPPNGVPTGCQSITPEMLPLVSLTQAHIDQIAAAVPGGMGNIQDIYPLAPLQEGILFHHLMHETGDAYLMQSMVAFDSRARLDQFISTLQSVIDRHDILRTSVLWEGLEEAVQVVWRQAPMCIEEVATGAGDVRTALEEQFDPRRFRIDVRHAPMIRGFFAHDQEQDRWLLQLLNHHLIDDNTTLRFLLEEIQQVLQGHPLLPSIPFRNYVAQARLGVPQQEHEAFFKEMLGDVDEPTAPYGVLGLKAGASVAGQCHELLVPALSKRLRERARHLGVSAASIMHLAWAQVLASLSGREDVVFGTVLFGRMQGGADRALGMFINTLPLRVQLTGQGAEAGVRAVHALLARLLRHEHAPLALAQRCSAIPAGLPLFSSLLNFRHAVLGQDDDGWEGIAILANTERTNYPLTMSVDDLGGDFVLTVQADAEIPAPRVLAYVVTVLSQLADALEHTPARSLDTMSVLPQAEREQVLEGWNATGRAYSQDEALHELIEAQVARCPHAVALGFDGQELSYGELNARANRLARHLVALGVGPDRRVAVCAERGVDMVLALLAVLKAGGAYVPLDPGYPGERLAHMLADSAPVAVLVDDSGARALGALPGQSAAPRLHLQGGRGQWSALSSANLEPRALGLSPDCLAYVIYTSGSTGLPKGAMNEHRGIVNRLLWMQEAYRLDAGDVVLQKTPFSFDVSVWEFFWPLMCGAKLVLARPEGHKDPAYLGELMAQQGVTTVHFVPSMLQLYLEQPQVQPGALKRVICSGEALPASLARRFHHRLSTVALYNLYGPTEAAVDVTAWQCQAGDERPTVPLGRPIANTRIYVLDGQRRPAPPGVAGEIHIGGVQVGRGYLNRPELTRERFVPDPFAGAPQARMYKTGDLGRWLPDGTVEYLGRIDFQVKIRGLRIELGEIEAQLGKLAEEVVVMVRQSVTGDARLVAFYTGQVDDEQLREHAMRALPAYMVPARFVRLDAIPLSPNGKIDRRALPLPGDDDPARPGYVAPATPTEAALCAIWQDLLGASRVGTLDNFFQLGGHSILVMRMLAMVNKRFDVNLTVATVFDKTNCASLGAYIDLLASVGRRPPLDLPAEQEQYVEGEI